MNHHMNSLNESKNFLFGRWITSIWWFDSVEKIRPSFGGFPWKCHIYSFGTFLLYVCVYCNVSQIVFVYLSCTFKSLIPFCRVFLFTVNLRLTSVTSKCEIRSKRLQSHFKAILHSLLLLFVFVGCVSISYDNSSYLCMCV